MTSRIKISLLAALTALVSVMSLTPAEAASGELVRRIYNTGANRTSVTFNPVYDSNGRYSFGQAWAEANCTNASTTVYYNPYFETLGSDRGYLRMVQVYMTPNRTWDMYQMSSQYYPVGGSYSAGPHRGYTTFYGGSTTAFSLGFERTVALNTSSLWFRTSATFIARSDADEPYCGVTVSPRWFRG